VHSQSLHMALVRRFRLSPYPIARDGWGRRGWRELARGRRRTSAVQNVPDFGRWIVNGIGLAAFGAT
jgi:hypothetical protein